MSDDDKIRPLYPYLDRLKAALGESGNCPPDMVNTPPHYKRGDIELVDIIEHLIEDYPTPKAAYHAATVIKYMGRAPYKDNFDQDIKKALWHLKRLAE